MTSQLATHHMNTRPSKSRLSGMGWFAIGVAAYTVFLLAIKATKPFHVKVYSQLELIACHKGRQRPNVGSTDNPRYGMAVHHWLEGFNWYIEPSIVAIGKQRGSQSDIGDIRTIRGSRR